jgi:hypothetical protein
MQPNPPKFIDYIILNVLEESKQSGPTTVTLLQGLWNTPQNIDNTSRLIWEDLKTIALMENTSLNIQLFPPRVGLEVERSRRGLPDRTGTWSRVAGRS